MNPDIARWTLTNRGKKRKHNTRIKRKLWESLPHQCIYCGRPLTLETATVDHVIPISVCGINRGNCRLSCAECNAIKGDEHYYGIQKTIGMIRKKVRELAKFKTSQQPTPSSASLE